MEQASSQNNLWEIDYAVYAAATMLTPERILSSKVAKQQVGVKMKRSRQEASQIHSVIDVLTKCEPFGPRAKCILRQLRKAPHTLNLFKPILIKQKAHGKITNITLCKKKTCQADENRHLYDQI